MSAYDLYDLYEYSLFSALGAVGGFLALVGVICCCQKCDCDEDKTTKGQEETVLQESSETSQGAKFISFTLAGKALTYVTCQ